MRITRRKFIERSVALLSGGWTSLHAARAQADAGSASANERTAASISNASGQTAVVATVSQECVQKRALITIHLRGGNDGFNTVVPYTNGAYFASRPNLALQPQALLKLSDDLALHPSLGALHDLFLAGQVAIIQGVGWQRSTRSHVRAEQIWASARPNELDSTTAFARVFADSPRDFGERVRSITLDGFDSHVQQKEQHARALKELANAVSSLHRELLAAERFDDTLIVVFSEFGRRLHENENGGTEHGSCGPVFIIGGRVKGGIYGRHPDLTRVGRGGDLKPTVDFRSVYSTLIERWFQRDSAMALGRRFETLDFV